MHKLNLPQWHSPEHVRDILLTLPEKKRNRALYELIWQFDHYNPQGVPKAKPSSPPCACFGTTRVFRGWKTSNCG